MSNLEKDIKKDSEFRGLFLGEGYAGVVKYKRKTSWKNKDGTSSEKNYLFFRPQLSLGQRKDNKDIINWIKDRYGGSVWIARQISGSENRKPAFFWTITNIKKISEICGVLLDSDIPSKKRKSIEIVKEFCDWKLGRGLQTKCDKTDYEKMEQWYLACKNNHLYTD